MFDSFRRTQGRAVVSEKMRRDETGGQRACPWPHSFGEGGISNLFVIKFFFIDSFVSLAIPSLQLRLTTSLFSNLDSTLKTNTQYLSIVQCRVLVLICSHILLRSCLAQIPLTQCSAFNSDHYAH
jgi:hypothetical protein